MHSSRITEVNYRRWVQAVFRVAEKCDKCEDDNEAIETVDISEAMAVEMFGLSPSIEEVLMHPYLL